MIKVLRRISEYTLDEFKKYCDNNGLDNTHYPFNLWAITAHEIDSERFIRLSGPNTIVTVSGVVCLDQIPHKVKDKTLSLKEAFNAMITPDTQDYCVVLSPKGTYYVMVLHGRGHNVFKFSLNNDKK